MQNTKEYQPPRGHLSDPWPLLLVESPTPAGRLRAGNEKLDILNSLSAFAIMSLYKPRSFWRVRFPRRKKNPLIGFCIGSCTCLRYM